MFTIILANDRPNVVVVVVSLHKLEIEWTAQFGRDGSYRGTNAGQVL